MSEFEATSTAAAAQPEQAKFEAAPNRKKGAVPPGKLKEQNLATLDVSTLDYLTPEVISRQATLNIGTIGHVAHGKSTVVKAISGIQTIRFKDELVRNITIKLGYANAKIYKCDGPDNEVGQFRSKSSNWPDEFEEDGKIWRLQRHVSFVDCPGHDILMATMLNGAAVMDAALLLIAGNETCPQPQTSEHLAAIEIMRMENVIILQNKVDIVKPSDAVENMNQIKNFVEGTVAGKAPIIPISAVLKYNVDVVCEYIVRTIPRPIRNFVATPRLIIIRSFDVNKPGDEVKSLKGGVAGGSILEGVLRVNDEIEVRPGITSRNAEGKVQCTPIYSRIVSLYAEHNELQYAVPGGLIGVGTMIDPTLTRADRLVGQVLGLRDRLPEVFIEIKISYYLLKRLLGVKTADGSKQAKVAKLKVGESLLLNIGSTTTGGVVSKVDEGNESKATAKITLTSPVCTKEREKIALSRRIDKHFRLIGWGEILKGKMVEMTKPAFAGGEEKA